MPVLRLEDVIDRIPGTTMVLWTEMCAIVTKKLKEKKGIRIPKFARFTFSKRMPSSNKVCVFDTAFKRGLRCKDLVYPNKASCADLSFVELGNRLGISKDQCVQSLGHIVKYMYGLASRGKRLDICMDGVGVFWAKSKSIGMRFYTEEEITAQKVAASKRSTVGSHKESMCVVGNVESNNETDRCVSDTKQAKELLLASHPLDVPQTTPTTPTTTRVPPNAGSRAHFGGLSKVDNLLNDLRRTPSTNLELNDVYEKCSPSFITSSHSKGSPKRLKEISTRSDRAVEFAYERFHDAMREERQRLNNKHASIRFRLKQAGDVYKEKNERKKRSNADYKQILKAQADARRRFEADELRIGRRQVVGAPLAKITPHAETREEKRKKTRSSQLQMRRTLDRQIHRRRERERSQKERQRVEDDFYLQCVRHQILRDSEARRRLRAKERCDLRSQWSKQIESNALKSDLMKKIYGPL